MWYLNYLEKSAEIFSENFENKTHVLLFLGRRRIAVNNDVDFNATPASAQISMCSKPVTQSNGVVDAVQRPQFVSSPLYIWDYTLTPFNAFLNLKDIGEWWIKS